MKFRAALGFFTRLPIGSAPLPPTFRGVAVWLPVVGLIIGALVSLALGLAAQLLPAIGLIVGLLAALAVALATLLLPAQLGGVIGCLVWVFITGGLHLDGVADCGDGLLVEAPPERRLEIMKDSRLGTFGCSSCWRSRPRHCAHWRRRSTEAGAASSPLREPAAWPEHWREAWSFRRCTSPQPDRGALARRCIMA